MSDSLYLPLCQLLELRREITELEKMPASALATSEINAKRYVCLRLLSVHGFSWAILLKECLQLLEVYDKGEYELRTFNEEVKAVLQSARG